MKKYVTFNIINKTLFADKIVDIDTSGLKNKGTDERGRSLGFYGDLCIEKTDGKGWITISGEFGVNDYLEDYGFILIMNTDN